MGNASECGKTNGVRDAVGEHRGLGLCGKTNDGGVCLSVGLFTHLHELEIDTEFILLFCFPGSKWTFR